MAGADWISGWAEWTANHHFSDYNIEQAFKVIEKQEKNYYTACEQHSHTVYEPLEEAMEKQLFPKLEQLVFTDIQLGGKHEMKTRWHQNANVFVTDGRVYCGYKAAQGEIAHEYKCPIEKPCDVVEEGKKLLEMIEDLNKLSTRDFVKKYDVDPLINNFDVLVNDIFAKVALGDVTGAKFSDKNSDKMWCEFYLELYDDAALFTLYSFANANPEYVGYNRFSLVDGKVNYRDDFDDIFIPDNIKFMIMFNKNLSSPDDDYKIDSMLFTGEEGYYSGIVFDLKEDNVEDFNEKTKALTQFFNEIVCPLYVEEEKKAFDDVKNRLANKQNT